MCYTHHGVGNQLRTGIGSLNLVGVLHTHQKRCHPKQKLNNSWTFSTQLKKNKKKKTKKNYSPKTHDWCDIMKQFHNHGHLRDVIVSLIYMDRVREKGECGSCPWATDKHCHVTCQRITLEKSIFTRGLWDCGKLMMINSNKFVHKNTKNHARTI